MKYYVKLWGSVPEEARPPGMHPAWPVTRYEVADDAPDPDDGRLVMTEAQLDAYMAAERPAYEAACTLEAQRAWHADRSLPAMKQARSAEIDARTQGLLADGFAYCGLHLSLSPAAQLKMQGAYLARERLAYPVVWSTKDDGDVLMLHGPADIEAVYLQAMRVVSERLAGGVVLKGHVRTAASAAELEAVVDER